MILQDTIELLRTKCNGYIETLYIAEVRMGVFMTAIRLSDIVIIAGLTLVNDTLDDLLKAIKPEMQIIVTGPSSSFIPEVLFANNVKIIGSVKITNPELMLKVVSEAGKGFHMFKYCAEKICIMR